MAQGKVLGKSGGGLNIQGIIEEYTASGNISAGDFVNYIQNLGTDTSLSSTKYYGYNISAVALSQNKVFIAHGSRSSNNKYLNGIICTISNNTISYGNVTSISSADYAGISISAVALSEDKVFIAHSSGGSGTGADTSLAGIVCTINRFYNNKRY